MSTLAPCPSSPVADVGDRLAARLIEVDPLLATDWGVRTDDLPDLGPGWMQDRRDAYAAALSSLAQLDDVGAERVGADLIAERARAEVDWHDTGEALCEVQAALDSPLFRIRHCFAEMAVADDEDWELIARRLTRVPMSLAGYRSSLEVSRASGLVGTRRQVEASADAISRWAGVGAGTSVFESLVASRANGPDDALARLLTDAAGRAAAAFREMSSYLRSTYLPAARADDGVGAERFAVWSRRYAGAALGEDDYQWASARLVDANADQRALRQQVDRDGPQLVLAKESEHLRWAEREIDRAIVRTRDACVVDVASLPDIVVRPRPDGGTTPYYSPPSEDGSRAATVWWPSGDGPHEVEYAKTVLFHESVPGHHVESSFQRQAVWLSRFQRLIYVPGHSEGWGLYAERLAEEIGLTDTPRARLGCRGSQALRLASLLIDIGLHTGRRPPRELADVVGEHWTVAGAIDLVASQGLDQETAAWWVTNMIGRPAHRASYAAGERAWLEARTRASSSGESLHQFHERVLRLGPLGLDQLKDVARQV